MIQKIAIRLLALAALFCCATLTAIAAAPRPNIVLIMTDDQSPIAEVMPGLFEPHAFGPYGGRVFTPHIDNFLTPPKIGRLSACARTRATQISIIRPSALPSPTTTRSGASG